MMNKDANKDYKHKSKVLILSGNRILVLSKKGEYKRYTLVGGFIKKKESPKIGLIREVLEETGVALSVSELSFLSSVVLKKEGKNKEIALYYFVCSHTNGKLFINNEPHKFKSIDWVPWQEALNYLNATDKEVVIDYFNTMH